MIKEKEHLANKKRNEIEKESWNSVHESHNTTQMIMLIEAKKVCDLSPPICAEHHIKCTLTKRQAKRACG